MKLRRYTPSDAAKWNDFIQNSKNGTFLFQRSYMDYHSDRFVDHSLVATTANGQWIAVLPATEQEKVFSTHAGLTYGGWVSDVTMTCPYMMDLFDQMLNYVATQGFMLIKYKTVPYIYHRLPAQEDVYALFRKNAILYRRDTLSVLDLRGILLTQDRRKRGAKKALQQNVEIQLAQSLSQGYVDFWQCLEANLQTQFEQKPTHSLAEILKLRSLHSHNICLHCAYLGGELCAGVVVYLSEPVCHVQYISASPAGKESGALDLLFLEIIAYYRYQDAFWYLDFGISNEQDGRYLNLGLIEQKEGFGARTVVHDFYQLTVPSSPY